VGKKLNKKDLLSSNLATKHGYCTQRGGMVSCRLRASDLSNYRELQAGGNA